MRLAIDIGNTSVSLGWFDGARLARRERIPTCEWSVAAIERVLEPAPLTSVTLASVVPQAIPPESELRRLTPHTKILSSADTAFSFPIEASPRARIGIDRLVNAEAVWREHPGQSAIVLDCGTATTLSVLHPSRGFLGGAIAPGIELMRDSLARGGAQLFEVPLEAPPSAIGPHTVAALQSGIVFGYAAMVDGLIERVRAELRVGYPVFATGGNARHLLGVSQHVREWDPDLTLRGIASLT